MSRTVVSRRACLRAAGSMVVLPALDSLAGTRAAAEDPALPRPNRFAQPGQAFSNSISADQVAARQIGGDTRYDSIQLSGSEPQMDGPGHGPGLSRSCDSGGRPMAAFNTPVIAFQRLFAEDSQPLEVRQAASGKTMSRREGVYRLKPR